MLTCVQTHFFEGCWCRRSAPGNEPGRIHHCACIYTPTHPHTHKNTRAHECTNTHTDRHTQTHQGTPRLTHHPALFCPPHPLQASPPPCHNQGSWPGWVGGCGVWELERNSRRAPSAPLANVKCLQPEKNRPERLFRLEINVTEKCGSRAINAAFFATHYVSALKREGAHFWHVFNLLGSG